MGDQGVRNRNFRDTRYMRLLLSLKGGCAKPVIPLDCVRKLQQLEVLNFSYILMIYECQHGVGKEMTTR